MDKIFIRLRDNLEVPLNVILFAVECIVCCGMHDTQDSDGITYTANKISAIKIFRSASRFMFTSSFISSAYYGLKDAKDIIEWTYSNRTLLQNLPTVFFEPKR